MSDSDSKPSSETDWARISALADAAIDTSEIPPLDEAFFARARLRVPSSSPLPPIHFRIELAQPADLPALPEIERRACALFEEIPATAGLPLVLTQPEDLAAALGAGLLWIAREESGRPVGFALVEMLGPDAHLEELDVFPEYGRRGIGTALVRRVQDWARETARPAVSLCTFRDVPWNAPFYERLRFQILDESEQSPELRERIHNEEEGGLARDLRVAMRWKTAEEPSWP